MIPLLLLLLHSTVALDESLEIVHEYADNYIVVLLPTDAKTQSSLAFQLSHDYDTSSVWTHIHGFHGFAASLTPTQHTTLLESPHVDYIEPDLPVFAYCPDVQTGSSSWGQSRTTRRKGTGDFEHDASWGKGVDLYILDTGVNCDHEEFSSCVCGPTFADGDDGCSDGNSHGSFCASIAAGRVYGLAKSTNIVGVKVLADNGVGSISSVIQGMNYVASQPGIRVASMSLGGGFSQASNDAADALVREGVPLAVAAGNSNKDACAFSPASAPLAITVGASDQQDRRSSFSNYGACLDIFAPGSDITGADRTPGLYVTGSGTSMATPHVAAILSALRSQHPDASPAELQEMLASHSTRSALQDVGDGSPNRLLYMFCEPLHNFFSFFF